MDLNIFCHAVMTSVQMQVSCSSLHFTFLLPFLHTFTFLSPFSHTPFSDFLFSNPIIIFLPLFCLTLFCVKTVQVNITTKVHNFRRCEYMSTLPNDMLRPTSNAISHSQQLHPVSADNMIPHIILSVIQPVAVQ